MYTPTETHYFLGANAPGGFYSLYDGFADVQHGDRLYILKGGPGCGKSSFMKTIAKEMQRDGLEVEFIHCSGDPGSLDGIYIPARKTAYVDGTAPHVIEPQFPGVAEQYVNLGDFYDMEALAHRKTEVIELNRAYKALYQKAYACITSASSMLHTANDLIVDDALRDAVRKRTLGIVRREFGKKKGTGGKTVRRFLSSFTCEGYIARFDTVEALSDRVYALDNNLGLAHVLLTDILNAAEAAGVDAVCCPSPTQPDTLEHLILPGLSLAFVSSNAQIAYEGPHYRHIRLDAMADGEKAQGTRTKLRFSKKVAALLMQEGQTALADAKKLHDELEAIYNPCVDFDAVYALAERHVARCQSGK